MLLEFVLPKEFPPNFHLPVGQAKNKIYQLTTAKPSRPWLLYDKLIDFQWAATDLLILQISIDITNFFRDMFGLTRDLYKVGFSVFNV